jgi:hypothetical protein
MIDQRSSGDAKCSCDQGFVHGPIFIAFVASHQHKKRQEETQKPFEQKLAKEAKTDVKRDHKFSSKGRE